MTAAAMLAEAARWVGTIGRPNALTRAYAARHGNDFLSVAWCDISVTEWARRSGNAAAVLPRGDRAYTVWHATDFQKAGRWRSGTTANVNAAKPGDIVFFDWGATNDVGAIDHVGVVEKVLGGGRVQTIEGNTGDACRRRVRGSDVIAGYGRPAYGEDDMPFSDADKKWMKDTLVPAIREVVWNSDTAPAPNESATKENSTWRHVNILRDTYTDVGRIKRAVGALAQQAPDVDEGAVAAAVLAALTPERIAAAIPVELAQQVVDELAKRLAAT